MLPPTHVSLLKCFFFSISQNAFSTPRKDALLYRSDLLLSRTFGIRKIALNLTICGGIKTWNRVSTYFQFQASRVFNTRQAIKQLQFYKIRCSAANRCCVKFLGSICGFYIAQTIVFTSWLSYQIDYVREVVARLELVHICQMSHENTF